MAKNFEEKDGKFLKTTILDILSILYIKNKIGLDKILLASELVSLNEVSAAKIKLLSLFFNKIYNIGIVVNKIELVDITEQKIIKSILTDLAKINTVWIL